MEIEDKMLLAKIMDKVKISKTRNKILNTEFLTTYQREIVEKELNKIKVKNYMFFGGYDGSEGRVLIIYPEKLDLSIIQNNLKNIVKGIKIKLPKELAGKYTHRDYLGTVMQIGLNRDRIGDIIVYESEAYIFVLEENASYIVSSLESAKKFSKSIIEIIDYNEVPIKESEFEEIEISVSSIRLDNVVSSIAKISRKKAEELLVDEKIFVNAKVETKSTKSLKGGDILVIRGKGKFIINKISENNRKGKMILEVKKYI